MKLSSLHALLDVTECLVLESFVTRDPKKDERDREMFIDSLYRPVPDLDELADDDGFRPVPSGFDDGGEDAFDQAMRSVGAS